MNKAQKNSPYWISCNECFGSGKKRQRPRKKNRLKYQKERYQYEKTNNGGPKPIRPKGHLDSCKNCFEGVYFVNAYCEFILFFCIF